MADRADPQSATRPAAGPSGTRTEPSVWITVLGVAYTVLAVAALSRSIYQAATGVAVGRAWFAVALSAVAGVVYVVAAIGLRRGNSRSLLIARWCLAAELVGVIAVSLVELAIGGFGRAAVWSGFGIGYGYLPVLLPVLGLVLIRPARPARPTRPARTGRRPAG